MDYEYAIIGGGIVGLSVAYGLARLGRRLAVFDEGDGAFRASRGNFGLVWVQGKGAREPNYARWTRKSAAAWAEFAAELSDEVGGDLSLVQKGGFHYHLDEESLHEEAASYKNLKSALDGDYPYEVLGHNALKKEEPNIGPNVAGAILHHEDGHVNPLRLLRTLATAVRAAGVEVHNGVSVETVEVMENGYRVKRADGTSFRALKVVLCAGLGAAKLGPRLGFKAPVRPQRGHVLITSRMPPIMHRPSGTLRQVDEGGVQIGASADEAGLDDRDDVMTSAALAREAVEVFPVLENASLVRSWAALRIMSPDGLPIYEQSATHPGAYMATCHSGITLAAAHARFLPLWLEGTKDAPDLSTFSEARF